MNVVGLKLENRLVISHFIFSSRSTPSLQPRESINPMSLSSVASAPEGRVERRRREEESPGEMEEERGGVREMRKVSIRA